MWHVDNLMINHVDPEVVTSIIDSLSKKYGDLIPLSINGGGVHAYLGMVFDFNTPDKVKITVYQYIYRVINGAPEIYKVLSRENGVEMATTAPHNIYDFRSPESERN